MRPLDFYKQAFNSVGWFIPPFKNIGFLGEVAKEITVRGATFTQHDLEQFLARTYCPENLAAMVTELYPITPYVSDYKLIISEAIEAHFSGLDHISTAGLMPAIEGAGRKLAKHWKVPPTSIKRTFKQLATNCKKHAIRHKIGATDEIASMMDSFIEFTKNNLYIDSEKYAGTDKTNRHGILHGAYADRDYGKPINFYKSIAAIDFLCFISAYDAGISWFAPSPTERSETLSEYYFACVKMNVVKNQVMVKANEKHEL